MKKVFTPMPGLKRSPGFLSWPGRMCSFMLANFLVHARQRAVSVTLVLCVAVLTTLGLVGCEDLETYTINAPADLQSKIDSIAAARAGQNTGDTTHLDIATAIVGAEDNSAAWWTAFSDYFTIPANKLLHIEFVNHSSGAGNFNNWNLAIANVADRDAETYAEYFVLRSDAFGWGNADFKGTSIINDYPDTDGDGDVWNDFRATMQGACVTIEIDHSATGDAYVTATAVGTNGTTLVETYQQKVSATESIVAFLIADGSHFQMKKAYLLPSKAVDTNPVSIAVTGAPASVELGNENFWGNAAATVTFADGSSEQIDSADLSFNVIPDMATIGTKTVIVAYSKTKQGAAAKAVSTLYTLAVTSAVVSIAASDINYYYYSSDDIVFKPQGIVVTATYSDGSTAVLENNDLEFEYPATIPSTAGTQDVDITYVGKTSTFTTTSTVTLVKGTSQVGKNDFSTTWWTEFSADYAVASGSSKAITLYCYSNNLANWNSPTTILRKADNTEYAVVRMDNFGWGSGYDANPNRVNTFDWNWDVFQSSISGSKVVITVTNHGNNKADILYNVTYANGETHFQKYAGITVNSADLNFALVTEGAYLVIVN
jgi:hypothetical protein